MAIRLLVRVPGCEGFEVSGCDLKAIDYAVRGICGLVEVCEHKRSVIAGRCLLTMNPKTAYELAEPTATTLCSGFVTSERVLAKTWFGIPIEVERETVEIDDCGRQYVIPDGVVFVRYLQRPRSPQSRDGGKFPNRLKPGQCCGCRSRP